MNYIKIGAQGIGYHFARIDHQNDMNPIMNKLLLILALTFPALATADQLIMTNGDIITGKISKVTADKITIQPEYAPKFEVNLAHVVTFTTESSLQVEMEDGSKLDGRFEGLEDDKLILLVDDLPMPIAVDAFIEAAPAKKFYNRQSNFDGLLSVKSGNTESRSVIFNADTRLRLGEHRQYAKLTIRRDEQNGVSTKKQNQFRYTYDWIFRRPWYLGLTADYERDPIRALSHRATVGALLGRDLFNDEKGFLTVKFGAGYSAEKLDEMQESGAVGLWELFFEHDWGKADVFHDHGLIYQAYGNNNMIFKSNTGVKVDIFKTLYAKLSYSYDYESEPAVGKSKSDSTLAVGVGAKF